MTADLSSGKAPAGRPAPVPAGAGIGLKPAHGADLLASRRDAGWLEIHAENYMAAGGPAVMLLDALARDYPISVHGVGLSLGSAGGLDPDHLERLAALVHRVEPGLVSEHLAWCVCDGTHYPDLLPLPSTTEVLETVRRHVEQVQERLQRSILVENPSRYLSLDPDPLAEARLLSELARRTGCGILLDVNNLQVSAVNLGFDPLDYLAALAPAPVGEIHLAGHSRQEVDGQQLLIDDHGSRVSPEVWSLYVDALRLTGPVPSLVEWDTDVPALPVLLAEAATADARLAACTAGRDRNAQAA